MGFNSGFKGLNIWPLCLQRYAIGQAGGDRAVPAGGHSRAV